MNPHFPDTRPDTRADDTHDAWLAHALRHAPDASADATAALSDAILRSARSAVARPVDAVASPTAATAAPVAPVAPARRHRSPPLLAAWAWLARPPVAAGFGSVMVATLVGVLWWGRPLDQALPAEPVAVPVSASASASASASVLASAPARQARVEPASPTAVDLAPVAMPPPPATPPPSPSTRPADKARSSAPQDARVARLEASPQAAANQAAPTAALQSPPPAASAAVPASETPQAATLRLGDQRKRASVGRADDALARAAAVAPAAAPAAAASGQGGPLQANAGPNAAPSALAMARPADAGRSALGGLLAAVLREPERWRWQRDAGTGEALAMTPNLLRWLAEADRATASQWRPAADGTAHVGRPALRLLRDGVLHARLGFDAGAWIETAGDAAPKTSTAALSAAAIEALTKALEEATR